MSLILQWVNLASRLSSRGFRGRGHTLALAVPVPEEVAKVPLRDGLVEAFHDHLAVPLRLDFHAP